MYETGPFTHRSSGCRLVQSPWKPVWQCLTKLNMHLANGPTMVLLRIYPRETKTPAHTKTCTQMFTVALFLTANYWKQFKGPSTGE